MSKLKSSTSKSSSSLFVPNFLFAMLFCSPFVYCLFVLFIVAVVLVLFVNCFNVIFSVFFNWGSGFRGGPGMIKSPLGGPCTGMAAVVRRQKKHTKKMHTKGFF